MATRKTAEVASVEDAEIVDPEMEERTQSLFSSDSVWGNLDDADVFRASAILETKVRLVGVPFIVTKVHYRTGAFRRAKELMPEDFVSLEAVTAPEGKWYSRDKIERLRKTAMANLDGKLAQELQFDIVDYVEPDEFVVINDSSTGIKRQITAYLAHKRLITPTVKDGVLPSIDDLKGGMGENVFDQNRDEWTAGSDRATLGIDVKAVFRQGLRISGYENDYNAEGNATFYLA